MVKNTVFTFTIQDKYSLTLCAWVWDMPCQPVTLAKLPCIQILSQIFQLLFHTLQTKYLVEILGKAKRDY
uniref:Uncharacterized protein n=1 Tax=Anguilla anguilla TaxID=7936 RepID=A0A0E9X4E1_ANGAN